MRTNATHIFILTCALAATSCSETSFNSGDKKGDSKSVDDEDEEADQPVQVSGAFLTCDWIENKKENDGETTLIGCGVYDKNGNVFPKKDREYQLSLHHQDGTKADMKTSDTGENTSFHRYAQLPTEFNDQGYLKMIVRKGSDQGEYTLPTVDIGMSVLLGQEDEGEVISGGGILLTQVISQAHWVGGPYGFADEIRTEDFCKKGNINSELSSSSQTLVALGGLGGILVGATPPTTKITRTATTFKKDEGGGCFFTFKSNKDSGRKFAHQSEDGSCFFLRSASSKADTNHILHIIKASSDSKINLENLRAFASTRTGCK